MRNVLAVQLIATMLAGPWLCCCTVARLVPGRAAAPDTAQMSHACCGHAARHAPASDDPAPKPRGDRPADKAPCPCKDKSRTQEVTLPPPDGGVVDSTLRWSNVPVFGLDAAFVAGQPVTGSASCAESGGPPLSGSDRATTLLLAHHNLRC